MRSSTLLERAAKYDLTDSSERNWMPPYALTIQIVTTILLAIRLSSRFTTNGRPGIDDALIVLAWIFGTGLTACTLIATYRLGFNRHVWMVPEHDWWKGGLIGLVIESIFLFSTCLTKVSVLMFYRRLVSGTYSLRFKWAIWTAIGFVIAYTIVFFILVMTTCTPLEAYWRQYDSAWTLSHRYHCSKNKYQVRLSELAGALSVVTDFYSVMLPAALIMRIRINKRQKYGLFFIFGVGFLVVGAGIARTYFLGRVQAETYDKFWRGFDVFVASIAECNVGIICACAPSLKAVFGRFFRDVTSRYGSGGSTKNNSKNNSNQSSDTNSKFDTAVSTLKRTTSKMKVKIGGEKKSEKAGDAKDESSFKEAHEYGLSSLEPVAQGYGDDLVAPMEDVLAQITYGDEKPIRNSMHNRIRNVPGPGSFIISPSPSVSSDDEASLVEKHDHDGLPYGLPEREEQLQFSVRARPSGSTDPFHNISSPMSETSFLSTNELAPQQPIVPSDRGPPRRVRRKLSKEKWRQAYESQTRYPAI